MSRHVEEFDLQLSLSEALRLNPSQLIVIPDYPMHDLADDILVICMTATLAGDFPFKLSIDFIRGSVEFNRIEVARKISRLLNVRLLIDDGSPSPNSMMLIHGDEKPCVVTLDGDAADEGIYRLKNG
ncbi:hypothetical protein [Roseateles depolymerans]|uniref:hypothetical protein n=1 Tax=Roseateles depolymerans TaxID=76731 RepID=UPI000E382447|nr:hypothetical protein [Roseateles depolymerans]REG13065.1 hypothetical protein DES44_4441 [Roseateles depolymerans]